MGYRDNIAEVLAGFDDLLKGRDEQTLTMVNNMEYASYLQDKEGYYVFSDEDSLRFVYGGLKATAAAVPLTRETVALTLEKAGFDIVSHERSLTAKLRPPVKAGDGMRQAHPGGWADITSNLASSYGFRVNGGPLKGGTR